MEKNGERIEAELELAEEIIQHIQSFLDGKEAAQTTLVSRSWYQAWLTRPNLDFDQKHFANKSDSDHDFWKLVTTTVERYENLNIKIDSLRLWIHKKYSLVSELIIKALKSGATCLDFKIHNIDSEFTFPHQVFGFETLTRLSVRGCKIGVVEEEDNERLVIKLPRIKCLTLKVVVLPGNNVIWDIFSSCPLIENFSLAFIRECGWLPEDFGKQHFSNEFHKLKSLYLCRARAAPSYFDHLCSKFPCLVDLTLHDCIGCRDIQISSPSLECIRLYSEFIVCSVKFDVPRIRKFTLMVPSIPLLSFEKTNTSNWRSNIHIKDNRISCAWFRELSRLLKKLRSSDSEVVLGLYTWPEKPSVRVGKLRGLCNRPKVFHMTINGPCATFPDFYSSLFKICRPSCIEPYWIPELKEDWGVRMIDCDLRKAKLCIFDESISDWCTRLVDTTSTTSIRDAVDDEQIFKWGPKILGIRRELE